MATASPINAKKRKQAPETTTAPAPTAPDDRFNFSPQDLDDDDGDGDKVSDANAEADAHEDIEAGDALAGPAASSNPLPAHLLPAKGKSHTTPGLIYLSRVPPGMGPSKVKHVLSAYGEVGRVFLARADADPPQNSKKRQKDKHREHRFKEGWVEFLNKKVARSVAEMLNANNIGGKKGTRWRDDVWTMKYLPRFRWDMLSEQVALERATQTSLLRFHLQHSRTEQESYLGAVEKARVRSAMETKAEARREGKKLKVDESGLGAGEGKERRKERERNYRQREVIGGSAKVSKASNGELDGVLDRLF